MDHETFWQAVSARRREADGAFVYAVRTTGVYCRPSCPSRRPRRDNVEFFAAPEAAERAGYRPCRRCRPTETRGAAADPSLERVRRICREIDRALEDGDEPRPPRLVELGEAAGASPHHLQRDFTRRLGISPRDYADARRLARVKRELRAGDSVAEAVYGAGYGSSSRLYERAGAQLGMTPASYAKGGKGARIFYTLADCAFGRALVAATERGVCTVSLGDDDATLEAQLHAEFPAAALERNDARLRPWLEAVLRRLAGAPADPELPFDLRATAFQWRVWQALCAIPRGRTATYGEVAAALGHPSAGRAVARACAGNKVAVLIPCHRVVRGDGGLGGYRWGSERKAKLLAAERGEIDAEAARGEKEG